MKQSIIYETHIETKNLTKAIIFYQELGLHLAHVIPERKVAFFWIGDATKKEQMLGVWETPEETFRPSHFAFGISYENLLQVPTFLAEIGIELTPSFGLDTSEPVVHTWMPAACYYFSDPDGNSLEYISLLKQEANDRLPVMHLSKWLEINE
ncbi:VOC family protein [Bacillus sp. BGMRC 2118]|nr:VOC family protein [Bacillus sp. BGMRC 2118]